MEKPVLTASPMQPNSPIIRAYFDKLDEKLIEYIHPCTMVLGCVAWFTLDNVIASMRDKPSCVMVCQQDWGKKGWNPKIYSDLTPISFELLKLLDPRLRCLRKGYQNRAIRAVGNPEGNGNQARMHHKFLILRRPNGVGVWTGSFNLTTNACESFENAIYTEDPTVVRAYESEFVNMLCLSCEFDDEWVPEMYYTIDPKKKEIVEETGYRFHDVKGVCWNCGRKGHMAPTCYAHTDVNGYPL